LPGSLRGKDPLGQREELPEDKNTTPVPGIDNVPYLTHPAGLPPGEAQSVDERRHPRAKCFLAVELRLEEEGMLVLGSLSEVSLGGCCVETPTLLSGGTGVAISLLETNGLLWVNGIAVNARIAEGTGNLKIGIKFTEADPVPSHSLREFLRFVQENGAKQVPNDSSYLCRLAGH
jgi:hypothetical protein